VDTRPHVAGHFGLRQMLERLEALDGELELGNPPSGGFRVAGRFPIGR
jgi:signal transduction histidine kinase